MQTYERIDIRKRTKELTDIKFGSKKGNPEASSLFDGIPLNDKDTKHENYIKQQAKCLRGDLH